MSVPVRWWESVREKNGLLLVESQAGVGKTRLVEEVTRYIESGSVSVLRRHRRKGLPSSFIFRPCIIHRARVGGGRGTGGM